MLEVHVNFGSAEEASTVARQAVEKRLAASANIHAPIRSFYWWEQEVRVRGRGAGRVQDVGGQGP